MPHSVEIKLPTGTVELVAENSADLTAYCDVAARANPKRGFLIVSKVLGRHLPASPSAMRDVMDQLSRSLPADLPGPIVFLGMAETATALGQGTFSAYRTAHPSQTIVYLQSSRQIVDGATVVASFEEGHSHATTHLVQIVDPMVARTVHAARTLIIIDDECSTGGTFVAAATAMMKAMPNLERLATCCITDWSGDTYLAEMPHPTAAVSILRGTMSWQADATGEAANLAEGSNGAGRAPLSGMKSRSGLAAPERAIRLPVQAQTGERVLVLGEGEHSYEALLVAEEVEARGGIAAVQCITRSPALLGFAMTSRSIFTDSYSSGAPCFLYNILSHAPDRLLIVAEVQADQIKEAQEALAALGSAIPVELVLCSYGKGE